MTNLSETELREIEKLYKDNDEAAYDEIPALLSTVRELQRQVQEMDKALNDIRLRAQRIREDKAIVGVEATFIERIARAAMTEDKPHG